ncbi:MAG TPA: flagellar export protein FliJ [Gammaproteobacteria bacterium]|nr:flagellar export protein FliJ [Gammaproteobacteria bacterium]
MKKSRRLKPVVRVAEGREQQAARALGAARARLGQVQQQLEELRRYRDDYRQRFQQAGAVGMGAVQMADYQQFLHKLGQAIEQQGQQVVQATQAAEAKRALWFASRGKVRMLDTLVARYQAIEEQQASRREQREQDERSQRGGRFVAL